jgi:hypothetical protein
VRKEPGAAQESKPVAEYVFTNPDDDQVPALVLHHLLADVAGVYTRSVLRERVARLFELVKVGRWMAAAVAEEFCACRAIHDGEKHELARKVSLSPDAPLCLTRFSASVPLPQCLSASLCECAESFV